MTPQQEETLKNTYLVPVSRLEDGDLLCLDKTEVATGPFGKGPGHFGPYILTREGWLQDPHYHYRYHHGLNVKTTMQVERPPCMRGYGPIQERRTNER